MFLDNSYSDLSRDQLISLIVRAIDNKLVPNWYYAIVVSRGPVRALSYCCVGLYVATELQSSVARVQWSKVVSEGSSVMSERDSASLSVVAAGACCRVRRRMQCFGFRGNCPLIARHARQPLS